MTNTKEVIKWWDPNNPVQVKYCTSENVMNLMLNSQMEQCHQGVLRTKQDGRRKRSTHSTHIVDGNQRN